MLSHSLPGSSETPKIPAGVIIHPNKAIEINGTVSPTYSKCFDLKNQEYWDQNKEVTKLWINQASDEDIFKYMRGDFQEYLYSFNFSDIEYKEELETRVLNFIWSKNPELQEKYPHFEGISTLTEAQKIGYSPRTGKPWISLIQNIGNKNGRLSIYTRPTEVDEFTVNFYLIRDDGSVEFQSSHTQSAIKIAQKKHETSNRVLDTLIGEAKGDQLKIAQAFLADAIIKTAKHKSRNKKK